MHRITAVLVLLLILSLATVSAFGQGITSGSIGGTVTDKSGAVVSGASITAKNIDTNQTFVVQSNEAGVFLLPKLPPGSYTVIVEAPQFSKVRYASIEVRTASNTQLGQVALEVGGRAEAIEVTGAAPLIESTTAQVTNTFDSKEVSDLPIGRGIDQLAMFLPGVSTAGSVGRGNNNGALFSANGQRPRSNNFQIDGQGMNDASVTGPAIFVQNNDIIAEYQVMTHYDAQYGRNMGSQVNLITKRGSNGYHGTAFENYRPSTFDSLTELDKNPLLGCSSNPSDFNHCGKRSRDIRNNFGFTVGGPILKDKVWFFGSGVWDRERAGASPISSGSLMQITPNGLNSLKAAVPNSPAVKYLEQFGWGATAGNPTFSNLATKQVNVGGGVTVPVEVGTVNRSLSGLSNTQQYTARADWQISNKDTFFARYLIDDEISTNLDYGEGYAGLVVDVPSRGQQIGLDWTHQFTNVMTNQVRFNYTRLKVGFEGGTLGCTMSNPWTCPTTVAFQDTTLGTMGLQNAFPQGRINNTYQLQDNANWLLGRHSIKFGGEYTWAKPFSDFLPTYNGTFTFPDLSSFVQNTPYRFALTDGPFRIRYSEKQWALYVQDDWKYNSKLTFNFGLRYEWFQNTLNQLHEQSVAQQTGAHPYWNTSLPLDRTTTPAVPEDRNNFGPNVGFAWTPRNSMVVRGGFRIAYDPIYYNIHLNVASLAPFVNAGTLTQGLNPVVPGLPTTGYTAGDIRTYGVPYIPVGVDPGVRSQSTIAGNFHNPYSEQWNLGVSHEFGGKAALEVRYLGNHTLGLFQQVNGNPSLTSLINAGFSSFIPSGMTACATAGQPGYASGYVDCSRRNVVRRQNSASSIYHGMQSKFDFRSYHGLTGTVSYTWSHTIDTASDIYSTAGAGMLAISQNPFDWGAGERANSNFDYRHTMGMQLIYELPFYKKQNGWAGKLLGGWQGSPTYRFATGQPYTPYQSKTSTLCDPTGTFSTTTDACRPILGNANAPFNAVGRITAINAGVPTVVNVATGAATTLDAVHWIVNNNNAATYFKSPFMGIGRNRLNGQATNAVNLTVAKQTKISESVNFQLSCTTFNLFNHLFRGVPGNNINRASTSFGNWDYNNNGGGNASTLESGLSRRRLEFGAKILF